MTRVKVPAAAAKVLAPLAAAARRAGKPLYAVGGPVRDWILKRPNFDLDLAVAGDPDPVANEAARLLGGIVEPFGRFGTRRVNAKGKWRVDVATTRAESYPEPAALPVVTATEVSIELDLKRRDFTINAMAVRLDDGSNALVDPYGGMADLKAKVARVLHDESFRDDPTRVFRAARFMGRFGWKPAPGLVPSARAELGHAAKLSPHRRLHELLCLLGEKDPGEALSLLREWGYLVLLHPELEWRKGMPAGVEERLAALALSLGEEKGRAFLHAYPIEHELRVKLAGALNLAFSPYCPRIEPDPLVVSAVRRFLPKLPAAALKPCFLRGEDLIKSGRKPGPAFHTLLDESAKLQREGKLKTRAAALAWLKKRPIP